MQPPLPFPETVPRALGHLRVALQDAYLRASRRHGLSPAQAELLCAALAPVPVGKLAHELRCDRTNITHLADRAAQRGWVKRTSDETDRRRSLIALTPEGEQLARRFIQTLEEQLAQLMAIWPQQRHRQAISIINELAETLDQHRLAHEAGSDAPLATTIEQRNDAARPDPI